MLIEFASTDLKSVNMNVDHRKASTFHLSLDDWRHSMTSPAKRAPGRPRAITMHARNALTIEKEPNGFWQIYKLTIAYDGKIMEKTPVGNSDILRGLFITHLFEEVAFDIFVDKREEDNR